MNTLLERFLKWNQITTLAEIARLQEVYVPIWECEGEKVSEYDCFFLLLIAEKPGITVNELRDRGGRTQGAISQKLIDFENRGIIRKEKLENDRRYTQITLTERGAKIVDSVRQLKLIHSQDAIDVLTAHGYTEDQISLVLEIYNVLEEYGAECRQRLYG
jgi:DNA-binding MarR family transcriptional regulator